MARGGLAYTLIIGYLNRELIRGRLGSPVPRCCISAGVTLGRRGADKTRRFSGFIAVTLKDDQMFVPVISGAEIS
jgi:hypothetical protein